MNYLPSKFELKRFWYGRERPVLVEGTSREGLNQRAKMAKARINLNEERDKLKPGTEYTVRTIYVSIVNKLAGVVQYRR